VFTILHRVYAARTSLNGVEPYLVLFWQPPSLFQF